MVQEKDGLVQMKGGGMRVFDYLETPASLLSADITGLLLEIRECRGRQSLWNTAKPEVLQSLLDVARVESVGASNRIEGIATTQPRLKGIVLRETEPHGRDEQEIAGYRDVLSLIHEQHDYIDVTANTILQLHRDLMKHTSFSYGGRWKDADNAIVGFGPNGERVTRFIPVSAVATPDAMNRLCGALREGLARGDGDSLLTACRFVFDFLCVHPFNDGNGRMSRLLTVLLMERLGYQVCAYVSIERLIEDNKTLYYEALAASSADWNDGRNDEAPFVRFMLGVILSAYRNFADRVDAVVAGGSRTKAQRVEDVLDRRLGKVTKAMIHEECPDISMTTIERALAQLLAQGRIRKVGSGRATGYVTQGRPADRQTTRGIGGS